MIEKNAVAESLRNIDPINITKQFCKGSTILLTKNDAKKLWTGYEYSFNALNRNETNAG